MKKIFQIFILTLISYTAQAQLQYGFKTGLNFNQIQSDDLRAGEELDSNTGFHIGAIFGYGFTDLMGVRGELLYSIKGGRVRYDGEGVFPVQADNGQNFIIVGNRRSTQRITNSYIEIPVTFYAKPLEWLEVSLGAQAGFLVTSTSAGQLIINGETTVNGQTFNVDEFDFDLTNDYRKDNFDDVLNPGQVVEIAGEEASLPSTVGAYYEYPEDLGNLYNPLDLSLVAGASFFINKGLFISSRLNYGLSDITNNEADLVNGLNEADNTIVPEIRSDEDNNFAVQISVGFIF